MQIQKSFTFAFFAKYEVYLAMLLTEKTSLDFSQFGKQRVYIVQITDKKGIVVGRKKVIVQ